MSGVRTRFGAGGSGGGTDQPQTPTDEYRWLFYPRLRTCAAGALITHSSAKSYRPNPKETARSGEVSEHGQRLTIGPCHQWYARTERTSTNDESLGKPKLKVALFWTETNRSSSTSSSGSVTTTDVSENSRQWVEFRDAKMSSSGEGGEVRWYAADDDRNPTKGSDDPRKWYYYTGGMSSWDDFRRANEVHSENYSKTLGDTHYIFSIYEVSAGVPSSGFPIENPSESYSYHDEPTKFDCQSWVGYNMFVVKDCGESVVYHSGSMSGSYTYGKALGLVKTVDLNKRTWPWCGKFCYFEPISGLVPARADDAKFYGPYPGYNPSSLNIVDPVGGQSDFYYLLFEGVYTENRISHKTSVVTALTEDTTSSTSYYNQYGTINKTFVMMALVFQPTKHNFSIHTETDPDGRQHKISLLDSIESLGWVYREDYGEDHKLGIGDKIEYQSDAKGINISVGCGTARDSVTGWELSTPEDPGSGDIDNTFEGYADGNYDERVTLPWWKDVKAEDPPQVPDRRYDRNVNTMEGFVRSDAPSEN